MRRKEGRGFDTDGDAILMRTATDSQEQKALDDIRDHGLHILHVMAHPTTPAFSYSVGLYETYEHPEIIIIGCKFELTQILLNNLAFDIKNGKRFWGGTFEDDVLDGFAVYFGDVPASEYETYVGWNLWLYENDSFPLLQCVLPTVAGKFPWDVDFPEDIRKDCPLLTEPPPAEYIS